MVVPVSNDKSNHSLNSSPAEDASEKFIQSLQVSLRPCGGYVSFCPATKAAGIEPVAQADTLQLQV